MNLWIFVVLGIIVAAVATFMLASYRASATANKLGLDVRKIVGNLISQTNEDQVKWIAAHMLMSDRLCNWSIKPPENDSRYVYRVELRIMAVFHFLALDIESKIISRNQKLLSGLLNAIKNQDKRLYDDPRTQRAIATAKKFENPKA